MFSTFKKLFGLRAETAVETRGQIREMVPAAAPRFTPSRTTARPDSPSRPVTAPVNATGALGIPLHAILNRLSPELMCHVRQMDTGDAEVAIPLTTILTQITQGAVRISFGELRRISPPGLFTTDSEHDRSLVEIPLSEVLTRLDPSLLSRRATQRQVTIPAEIAGPFNGQSQVMFSTTTLKPATDTQLKSRAQVAPPTPQPYAQSSYTPPAAPTPTPVQSIKPLQSVTPVTARVQAPPIVPAIKPAPAARPVAPVNTNLPTPAALPPRPAPAPAAPAPFWSAPAAVPQAEPQDQFLRKPAPQPAQVAAPVISPISVEPEAEMVEAVVPAAIAMPDSLRHTHSAGPITPIAPEVEPEPQPIRFQMPVPEPVAPPPPPPAPAETKFLTVSLADVLFSWPEAVQQEILAHQWAKLSLALPFGMIELAMKQGKISVPWRIVRSWIKPAVAAAGSPHDAAMLDLPLKVVTPLFLAELKSAKIQKKISIDENIPDLFSGRAPASAPAAVASPASPVAPKLADTNYFTKDGQVEEVAPVVKKGATPGTAFLVRYATPNEIVAKAASLDGVDGALIALPDGLLVASQIPASMNADTIAAFLPQIFGRVTQCTKELRLGELNNLNFTVGVVPWKIFKVGAIYFAAFGRAGEPLPGAQLAGIAAELDRKAK